MNGREQEVSRKQQEVSRKYPGGGRKWLGSAGGVGRKWGASLVPMPFPH